MPKSFQNQTTQIAAIADGLPIEEVIQKLVSEFPDQVTFSTSFSYEDQLISDIILKNNFPVKIFTLDTGRLFEETYSVWSATNERYHTHIKA
ncbi:MAG: phosphoadenosine phosphosulfate reductase family protein, partial [Ginsengibacter sp.]